MKKYLKIIVFSLLVMFSFYFTDKTALFVQSKDPIMLSIKEYSQESNYDAVNAVIDDNYIIPGMYGKRVNEVKSLMNMKATGVFNSLFLVNDVVKPDISLNNNKDKIIKRGNSKKQAISLILENDETNAVTYLISSKLPASLLVTKKTYNQNPYFEQINNDFDNYKAVDNLLNKDKINTNICVVGRNNKEICIKNKKYLVEPSLILNEANILSVKKNMTSGDIVLIKSSASIDDIALLINYAKSKGLKVIKLSELISEK